jgi:hypothetical protein
VLLSGHPEVDVEIDQARRDDEPARVDDFGPRRRPDPADIVNPSVPDEDVGKLVASLVGIDDPPTFQQPGGRAHAAPRPAGAIETIAAMAQKKRPLVLPGPGGVARTSSLPCTLVDVLSDRVRAVTA